MTSITYCKALPTPIDELNAIGKTQLEMFLSAYTAIFYKAVCETVNFTISGEQLNKSHSNWQNLRFQIHNKKRKLARYRQILAVIKSLPVRVRVPKNQAFIVGSKDESYGNQICQWDGNTADSTFMKYGTDTALPCPYEDRAISGVPHNSGNRCNLKVRVPACLESKFGKYTESYIGDFARNINRLPSMGAKTWHFYYQGGKWCVAVSFTPSKVKPVSRSVDYGCIGIDLNPGSIGWASINAEGNLKSHGQIPLQTGLLNGQQQAIMVKACLELPALATNYQCPIVCEDLDFTSKKEQLRERGKKYARMLSSWAYAEFFKLLNSILSNRGIELIRVNPAYSSIIGLVKYLRMYGLASDEAAALAIGRRGMRLSEKIPGSLTAFVEVNSTKHVWSLWNQLNKKIKLSSMVTNRHSYYVISNWDFLANLETGEASALEEKA